MRLIYFRTIYEYTMHYGSTHFCTFLEREESKMVEVQGGCVLRLQQSFLLGLLHFESKGDILTCSSRIIKYFDSVVSFVRCNDGLFLVHIGETTSN